MTYPLKSKRKRFDPTLYKVSDKLAKDSLTKYLVALGHDVNEHKERMGVDLESSLAAGAVRIPYLHEVEIKFLWEDEWPEKWEEVRIPYKNKYVVDRWYKDYRKDLLTFVVYRKDLKKAWHIAGDVVMESEVRNNFYCIPLKFTYQVDMNYD